MCLQPCIWSYRHTFSKSHKKTLKDAKIQFIALLTRPSPNYQYQNNHVIATKLFSFKKRAHVYLDRPVITRDRKIVSVCSYLRDWLYEAGWLGVASFKAKSIFRNSSAVKDFCPKYKVPLYETGYKRVGSLAEQGAGWPATLKTLETPLIFFLPLKISLKPLKIQGFF